MDVRPLGVGLILFSLLVLGGTIDRSRRKMLEQPVWFAQNWRNALKGALGWIVAGGLALVVGILMVLL